MGYTKRIQTQQGVTTTDTIWDCVTPPTSLILSDGSQTSIVDVSTTGYNTRSILGHQSYTINDVSGNPLQVSVTSSTGDPVYVSERSRSSIGIMTHGCVHTLSGSPVKILDSQSPYLAIISTDTTQYQLTYIAGHYSVIVIGQDTLTIDTQTDGLYVSGMGVIRVDYTPVKDICQYQYTIAPSGYVDIHIPQNAISGEVLVSTGQSIVTAVCNIQTLEHATSYLGDPSQLTLDILQAGSVRYIRVNNISTQAHDVDVWVDYLRGC